MVSLGGILVVLLALTVAVPIKNKTSDVLRSIPNSNINFRPNFYKMGLSRLQRISYANNNLGTFCLVNNGYLSLRYRRCFFIVELPNTNKTEQMAKCELKQAILTYPPSTEEIEFLWNFHEKRQNWLQGRPHSLSQSWFLHIGFQRARIDSNFSGSTPLTPLFFRLNAVNVATFPVQRR